MTTYSVEDSLRSLGTVVRLGSGDYIVLLCAVLSAGLLFLVEIHLVVHCRGMVCVGVCRSRKWCQSLAWGEGICFDIWVDVTCSRHRVTLMQQGAHQKSCDSPPFD